MSRQITALAAALSLMPLGQPLLLGTLTGITTATTAVLLQPSAAVAQSRKLNNAQCILITSEQIETMNEDCHFETSVNGSFTISKVDKTGEPVRCFLGKEDWDKDLKVKYPCIMFVSAWIIEEGVAEVRGLTTAGINSRWGRYLRDPEEPACWEYSSNLPALSKVKEPGDRICVYSK